MTTLLDAIRDGLTQVALSALLVGCGIVLLIASWCSLRRATKPLVFSRRVALLVLTCAVAVLAQKGDAPSGNDSEGLVTPLSLVYEMADAGDCPVPLPTEPAEEPLVFAGFLPTDSSYWFSVGLGSSATLVNDAFDLYSFSDLSSPSNRTCLARIPVWPGLNGVAFELSRADVEAFYAARGFDALPNPLLFALGGRADADEDGHTDLAECWEYATDPDSYDAAPDPVMPRNSLASGVAPADSAFITEYTSNLTFFVSTSGYYELLCRGDDLLEVSCGPLAGLSRWNKDIRCIEPDPSYSTGWLEAGVVYPLVVHYGDEGGGSVCSYEIRPATCHPTIEVEPRVIEVSSKWPAEVIAAMVPDVTVTDPCGGCPLTTNVVTQQGRAGIDRWLRKVTYTLVRDGETVGSDFCLYTASPEEDRTDEPESCCTEGSDMSDDCVSFRQKFGRAPHLPWVPAGRIVVRATAPTRDLFTTAALRYDHPIERRLLWHDGYDAIVCDGLGVMTEYRDGRAAGDSAGLASRIFHDGVNYIERLADGLEVVYRNDGSVGWLRSPYGERVAVSELGISVNRNNRRIASVTSVADGTMSAVPVVEGTSWRLDWTSPSGVPVKSFAFSDDGTGGLDLLESRGDDFAFAYHWTYDEAAGDWIFVRGAGTPSAVRQSKFMTYDSASRQWNVVRRNESPDGSLLSSASSVLDLSGGAARTTSRSDDTGALYSATRDADGFLLTETNERGMTTSYRRDRHGRVLEKTDVFADSLVRTTEYTYAFGPAHDIDFRPLTEIVKLGGVTVSHTVNGYGPDRHTRTRICGRTSRTSFTQYDAKGRVVLEVDEDGRATETAYSAFDAHGGWTETVSSGLWSEAAGFTTVPGKSTQRVSRMSAQGNATNVTDRALIGAEWRDLRSRAMTYDTAHRVTGSVASDGRTSAASWICTGPVWTRDEEGIVISNSYNAVKALASSRRYGPFGTVETRYGYDAEGRVVSERDSAEGLPDRLRTIRYDARGRIVEETDRTGVTVRTAYAADGRSTTRTNPDGGEETETFAGDGRLLSVTGSASAPRHFSYGVTPDGLTWMRTDHGLPQSQRFETVYRNGYGEIVREERSGANGATLVTTREYDASGHLVRETTTGEPVRTFSYDDWGDCVRSAETADGLARIVEETDEYVFRDNEVWRDSVRIISSSDPTIIPLTNRTQRLIGDVNPPLGDATPSSRCVATPPPLGDATPSSRPASHGLCHFTESRTIDARGNTSRTWSVFDPTTSTRTTYHQRPESSHIAISEECDGVGILSGSFSAVTNRVACDAYRRETARTDGRGNVTRLLYDAKGNVTNETDAAGFSIAFGYDAMNRRTSVTNALGDVTRYEYDVQGRLVRESGATYPVRYAYDLYGNRTSMTTYRDESSGTGDVTTWLYDIGAGVVTNKVYADGNGTAYAYDANGRLVKRTWARGIETDYSYDGFGNLTRTDYSDTTPSIAVAYDALGRKTSVTDVKGTTTYSYDAFGSLTNETTTGHYEKSLTRHVDAFGRDIGYSVEGERQTTLTYDPEYGRLIALQIPTSGSSVDDTSSSQLATTPTPTFHSHSYTWTYLPGTDLKASLAIDTVATNRWSYEQQRDLLTQVRNEAHGGVISQYDYTYDAAGRRVSQTRSGSAMSETRIDDYGYNARGELITATKRDVPGAPNDEVLGAPSRPGADDSDVLGAPPRPGADDQPILGVRSRPVRYAYQYDDIGNRLTSTEPDRTCVYTANNLNQYTSITESNNPNNSNNQTIAYDADGNQTLIKTKTGLWQVTYNGENRPILWTCGATNLVMKYDHMGRRVEYIETVTNPNYATPCVTNQHQRFVYDNYLCIQRLSGATNAVTDDFIWDPTEPIATRPLHWTRISAGINNASSVASAEEDQTILQYFYTHDGNKNVSEVVSFEPDEGFAAHYEFAPFGESINASCHHFPGVREADTFNPWRFASEYSDLSLNVVSFCFRTYLPFVSKWMVRDPIGVRSSINNYLFEADALSRNDRLGLYGIRKIGLWQRVADDEFEKLQPGRAGVTVMTYKWEGVPEKSYKDFEKVKYRVEKIYGTSCKDARKFNRKESDPKYDNFVVDKNCPCTECYKVTATFPKVSFIAHQDHLKSMIRDSAYDDAEESGLLAHETMHMIIAETILRRFSTRTRKHERTELFCNEKWGMYYAWKNLLQDIQELGNGAIGKINHTQDKFDEETCHGAELRMELEWERRYEFFR